MKKWLILLCMISAFVGCGNDENEIKQNFQENEAKESQNQSKETFINEERSLRSQSPQKWLEKYDVNAKDSNGETLLMFFAAYGSDDEVKYLLAQGADVKDESYPPLNDAVKYGLVNAVEALLKVGANPMQKGYSQTSALDIIGENKLERINGEYKRTLFHSLESEKQSRIKELINQAIETINP